MPIILTKELIEKKVSQETLISNYYGVPMQKGLFKAKHRVDRHATVGYYKTKSGKIIVKDFGSNYCGDWIYVVMNKFNCSYEKALMIAANDFGIQKYNELPKNPVKESKVVLDEKKEAIIRVEIRPFQQYELDWWAKFGITEKTLKKFRVFSCKNVFLNDNLFHLETPNQLVFGYYGGIKNGVEKWKIYFPGNRKLKFISNKDSSTLQGAINLPRKGGDLVIVQKSLKDVMLLYEFGISSVAPNSENVFLSDEQLMKLKSKFKRIIVWFDNDAPGKAYLEKIKKDHPELDCFYIPGDFKEKDFSDFYKKYGKDEAMKFLNKYILKCQTIPENEALPMKSK